MIVYLARYSSVCNVLRLWDERDAPLTQYITNTGITRTRYTITHFKNEQKVGMLLQKRTDTRGIGISSMMKSIYMYLLTTTPIVERGWNVWEWLVGVVSRRRVRLVGVGGIYGCGYWVWL